MPRTPSFPPKRTVHRGKERVRVYQDGKVHEITLGAVGSPEANAAYFALVAKMAANGGRLPEADPGPGATIDDVIARFWKHAEREYQEPDGTPKTELASFRMALRPLRRLYGLTQAAAFSPRDLKALQTAMATGSWRPPDEVLKLQEEGKPLGWARNVVNRMTTRVKTAFRWLESEGLVPPGTWNTLRTVRCMPPGSARETEPVMPVPEADKLATFAKLGPIPLAIAEILELTGARPKELLQLRPCDFQKSGSVVLAPGLQLPLGKVWAVVLRAHKTQHKGCTRILLFGPEAQKKLAPFMNRPADRPLFSPREAMELHREKLRKYRKTRVQPSQEDRSKPDPQKQPGEYYTSASFSQAIRLACLRAKVTRWHAYRLRHNAATRLVEQFGWDVARTILGHRSVETTRIYALDDLKKAVEAMSKAG